MKQTFVNFSRSHTNKWTDEMRDEALDLVNDGELVNVAFPVVEPSATKEEVYKMADECVEKIMGNNPAVVYCLGDLSLLYRVVELLKAKGVKVVTACNERIVSKRDEGKIAGFRFVQFREF
ncbi:MAG: hypothetical protein Q4E51_03580 [Lachnospiraceae bacterium]|nr:hypothetical protein [Lachnospiraceae bacterium]